MEQQEAIGVTLMGTKTRERLRANVGCVTNPLDSDTYNAVLKELYPIPERP